MKKITSICLTIFLGVNIVSAYAARGEQLAILSEDFSAFTEGTESTPVDLYFDSEHVRLPKRRTRLSFICKINTVATTIRVRNAPLPTNGKRSKSLFSTISVWGVAWSMYKSGHTTIRG